MKDYYIDPAWFYLINMLENLRVALFAFILLSAIVIFVLILIIVENDLFKERRWINRIKGGFALCIIFVLALVLIPSKQTCIEMMVAQSITPANVEYAKGELKDVVDYIFEKVEQVDSEGE